MEVTLERAKASGARAAPTYRMAQQTRRAPRDASAFLFFVSDRIYLCFSSSNSSAVMTFLNRSTYNTFSDSMLQGM